MKNKIMIKMVKWMRARFMVYIMGVPFLVSGSVCRKTVETTFFNFTELKSQVLIIPKIHRLF